ncbi:cathepsin B-like isoform X2 [Tetranychus urticae]|uniref:cathepsin B-like isoform X2 n=1 Tax=Tetranychus urticae TaxID=32264 RepID=UPI00077BE2E2|nr:cathepsin B-like isoform X2 [Tetranychus urticae]
MEGKNFDGSNKIEMDKLIVTHEETFNQHFTNKTYSTKLREHTPETFDARVVWPNCTSIGKVYDQKKGYPSWIYAAVGSIADRLCIQTGAEIDVEATVEQIIRSNGGFNSKYNSANIGQAFNYWSKKGIFTVKSSKDSSCLPLSSKCNQNDFKLDKYYKVTVESPDIWLDKMRDIMVNGPLPAYMEVYSDFPSYKSGVYQSVSHRFLGMHNVKLIGWGVENGVHYWLVTNSWGTEWGNEGFARIRIQRATFGVQSSMPSVTFELVKTPSAIPKLYQQDQLFCLA